jgi:hypothetical protein
MSCLDATFTLTPQSPHYSADVWGDNYAAVYCYGADIMPVAPNDLSSLYPSNQFFFYYSLAGDPNLDYAKWFNRNKAQSLFCVINLPDYAARKQLALIFGFDVQYLSLPGRVLVYTDAGLLQDQQLVQGDNQFLLEIESLHLPVYLYFIHVGGTWYFRGLSGYLV